MIRPLPALAVVLLAAVCAVPAPAAPPDALAKKLEAVIDGPDYKHASWGILVVDAKTGETVYARNPDAMLAPASVTKLFSCAAALVAIGADAKQETCVFERGLTLKGTLRGDLILVASGDLMLGGRGKDGKTHFKDKDHTYANGGFGDSELTDTDPLAGLNELAKQVKAAGITRVEGEVLIDDRLFARTRGSGSGPDAVTPIVVNDNVIDVTITPGAKAGDPAKVVCAQKRATSPSTQWSPPATRNPHRTCKYFPLGQRNSPCAVACHKAASRLCASIAWKNRHSTPARCSSKRSAATEYKRSAP